MAILRAGPYATSTDSFLDEPSPAPITSDGAYPVNCANNSVAAWRFKALKIIEVTVDSDYRTISSDIDEEFFNEGSGGGGEALFEGEGLYWRYQAVTEFTLSGSYSLTNGGGSQGSYIQLNIFDQSVTINETYGNANSSPETTSGTFSLTFPAATVPSFIAFALSGEASTLSATITLTLTG